MTRITYIPNRVIDSDGIADGAAIYVYQSGTTTVVPLFSDEGFTTPVSNPYFVPAGAAVPPLYTDYNGDIRLRIVSNDGSVPLDEDPYSPPITGADLSGLSSAVSNLSDEVDALEGELSDLEGIVDGSVVGRSIGAQFAGDLTDYRPGYRKLVLQRDGDAYNVFRKAGPQVWERVQMKTNTPGNPLRVGEIWLLKPAAYFIPNTKGSSAVEVGSGWGVQRSGGADLYVGGIETYNTAASGNTGETIEQSVTFDTGGDLLGIVIRKGDNTGMFRVTINGSSDLITLLPKDVNGDVIVDSYSPQQEGKVHIPLASALPAGTYTIEVEVLAQRNPASSTNRININGFYALGDGVSDPLASATHAPLWAPGDAVVTDEHRYWLGREYACVAGGTTGTNPPVHTGALEVASDGAVEWRHIRSSYSSDEQMIRQDTSESEFAGVLQSGSQWGGDIHGNEALDELEIVADGSALELGNGDVVRCFDISFKQSTTATDEMAGNAPMMSIEQRHDFTADGVSYSYVQTALKSLVISSFYQWMHTVYHYDQLGRRFLFDEVHTPRRGRYLIADSYGDSSAQFGLEASRELRATGTAFKTVGSVGNPTTTGGTHRVTFSLRTSDEAMGFYERTTAGAYVQLNPSGKNEPDGGDAEPNSGFFTKLYFASVRNNTLTLQPGDKIVGGGSWTLSAVQN